MLISLTLRDSIKQNFGHLSSLGFLPLRQGCVKRPPALLVEVGVPEVPADRVQEAEMVPVQHLVWSGKNGPEQETAWEV